MKATRDLPAALISGLLLAACAGGPPPELSSPGPGPGTGQPPAAEGEAEPEIASLPPLPRLTATEVLGFSRPDLVNTFGAPAFRRVDKGAEILRFRGAGCVLDVFLYAEAGPGAARIAHVEARDDAGRPTDRDACLNLTPRARG